MALACSYIRVIKNPSYSFCTKINLHVYYCTAQTSRAKSLSGLGGRRTIKSDKSILVRHAVYKKIIQLPIINILVLDSVIGAGETKGKLLGQLKLGTLRNKLKVIAGRRCLEESENKNLCRSSMHRQAGQTFKNWEGGKGIRQVGLNWLVAGATLPPTNQVGNEHKDD